MPQLNVLMRTVLLVYGIISANNVQVDFIFHNKDHVWLAIQILNALKTVWIVRVTLGAICVHMAIIYRMATVPQTFCPLYLIAKLLFIPKSARSAKKIIWLGLTTSVNGWPIWLAMWKTACLAIALIIAHNV